MRFPVPLGCFCEADVSPLLCPIIDRGKGYPFEVVIPMSLKVSVAVLSDQMKSLNWKALKLELICRLPKETVAEVLREASTLLSK